MGFDSGTKISLKSPIYTKLKTTENIRRVNN